MPAQIENPQDPFLHDPLIHLADTKFAILEDDRHFFDLESQFPRRKLHLYLECISDKLYLVQVDRLQHLLPVAHEPRGGVLDRHPGDQPGIDRTAPRKQDPVLGPVDIAAALYVPGTDRYVRALVFAGIIQPDQVLGIMREIGIHFEDERVIISDRPLESVDICRTQPQFTLTFLQEQLTGIFSLHLPDDCRRSIRGTIIDDQYMKTLAQLENSFQDCGDIFALVIGRYYDDLFQLPDYT